MAVAGPDALWKNYASKISTSVSVNLSASMLSVPETAIQQTQSKLFAFLWKNKRDKIKCQVLFRPLSKGGLSFPYCRTVLKALRLSWISRLLNNTHDTWTAIPNYYFDKHGGLAPFSSKL